MQDVSVLSVIENAWLKAYRFEEEKKTWSIETYSISPLCTLPCNILIIHRNAHSRLLSRLGRGYQYGVLS